MADVIKAAGGVVALAAALGVDRTTPYSWKRVPAHHARQVAELTKLPLHDLRPDLYAPAGTEAA